MSRGVIFMGPPRRRVARGPPASTGPGRLASPGRQHGGRSGRPPTMPADTRSLPRHLETVARAAAEAAAFLGAGVLLGWALDVSVLRAGIPGSLSVKPNAALAFVMAGLAARTLASRRTGPRGRRLARLGGLVVAMVGLATLAEYATGRDLLVDRLVFPEP